VPVLTTHAVNNTTNPFKPDLTKMYSSTMDVQNSLLYNIDAGNEKQERLGRSLFESVETCSFYSCIIMSGLKPVADQVQVWRERCCDSSDSVPQSPIIGVVQK